jgi:hypothetical protein
MRVRNKKAATATTVAAAVATGFASLLGASPAEAACASFWGVGNGNGCTSSPGSFAVVLTETGTAEAAGIGGAIALGEGSLAQSHGIFTAALASGKNTYAGAFGTGSLAQDVGNDRNKGSSAVSVGWFNRALNYGNDNRAAATSGLTPTLDLTTGNIDIGNNTVLNFGNDNIGLVGTALPGAPGGFSNGVYQIGNGNFGAAGGVLSNLVQVGDDNHGAEIPARTAKAMKYPSTAPNTAVGMFTTNNVFGNRNTANAVGNINGALIVGDDNENNVVGGPTENPNLPLPQLHPDLSASNVFGNKNRVNVFGNADATNVVGDGNKVGVIGNRNITSAFGDGNKVTPNNWHPNGIVGNNNITTSVGDQNKIGVFGNGNLTTNLGNRSKLRSFGDNNVNASLGDDKTSIKSSP